MGLTKTQLILSSVLLFLFITVLATAVVLVAVNGGISFDKPNTNVGGSALIGASNLGVPGYIDFPRVSGCLWDDTHNVCTAHSQGLINQYTQKYLSRDPKGYVTATENYLYDRSVLKFIGGTKYFIITAHDQACVASPGNANFSFDQCNQVFFYDLRSPSPGYFNVLPHNQVINRFALVWRIQDDPFYRYVNLKVVPHELCETLACQEIRNSNQNLYLAYGATGWYMTPDADNDQAIWKWDWEPLTAEPSRAL